MTSVEKERVRNYDVLTDAEKAYEDLQKAADAEKMAEDKTKSIHSGHRERMRGRFLKDPDLEGFAEHEILELMLFFIFPRGDTNAMAHRLLDTFGSVSAVVNAPVEKLAKVSDMGQNSAVMLKMLSSVAKYLNKQEFLHIDVRDTSRLSEYLKAMFAGEMTERFVVMTVSSNMRISTVEQVTVGGESVVYPDLRELAKAVFNSAEENIILVHNHPGGNSKPSQDDIILTRKIMQYFSPFGINVLDHFVVGRNSVSSMRACGFIYDTEC